MPFPETEKFLYNKNPLDRVICQLRFPPILRIDSEIPSVFQDAVRENYPLYNENLTVQQEIPLGLNLPAPQELLRRLTRTAVNKNHEFSSEDGIWKISLNRNLFAITTTKYKRWSEFREKFLKPFEALVSVYKPPFFTRVGLRYIDVFDRSILGLDNAAWCDLIKPPFIGLLSSEIKEEIKNFGSVYEITLEENVSTVRISASLVQQLPKNEQCFMVDSDFSSIKRISPDATIQKLDYFSVQGARLIRFMITDRLHNAMEPQTHG